MQELKRVFTNRTFLFGLIAILIINAVLFYNEQKENDYGLDLSVANEIIWNTDGQMTIGNDTDAKECYSKYINLLTQYKNTDPIEAQTELTAELTELTGADKVAATALIAQLNHINGYDDYLATIEANKDKLLNFSIFNSADSFTNRNINKTAEDFKVLSGITLLLDNDSSINAFMSFRLTDYFGVVLLAIVCISFLAERKKGLAKEKGYTNLVHFMDDGISGVTMDRPGFVDMIRQLEEGRAAAVFVKDLSRLGRNYIEVGRLTEEFFPEHDIRLVAVSDNIDTAEGENELAPIRNLFNEWYARDISKKRRISNKIKGNAGEPMGQPPYGYMKDPDNPKRWIVDDEAALVVKRIYNMTLDGLGTEQIAAQLERDGILTPRAYWLQKGVKRPGKGKQLPPTRWNSSTITKILSLQEYCGDILNFKTYSKSYKNKKRIDNDRENWVVFKDVHEPIIDRAVWEQVQQKRGTRRRRRTNDGEKNMFSGLLVCADCGNNLHYHFNQGNPEIKYFNCSNYKGNRGTCTSTHYVRVDFLEQVVLGEIKRLTKFASHYEDDFVKAVMGSSQQSVALDRRLKEKELASLQARDEELDGLFERIYEDNVSGKLSDDRFSKMSRRYEDEQKEISERIKTLRAEMDKLSSKAVTADMFISTVRKYTRAKALTPRMLNELIDRIEVHQAEKIDGEWVQHLTIHYNCVGAIFIPEVFPLPVPEVSVNTRKGVVVNYAPCQIAI